MPTVHEDADDTPAGRLVAKFLERLDKIRGNYYRTGHGPEFADRADVREHLRLYIERELKKVEIATLMRWGTYPAAKVVEQELAEIDWKIAKLEADAK